MSAAPNPAPRRAPPPIPFFAPRDTCNGSCMTREGCQCWMTHLGRESAEPVPEPVPDSVYADVEAESTLEQRHAERGQTATAAFDLFTMLLVFTTGSACGAVAALLYHFFIGLPS